MPLNTEHKLGGKIEIGCGNSGHCCSVKGNVRFYLIALFNEIAVQEYISHLLNKIIK